MSTTNDKEILARWMIANGYATGHGDSLADLVAELAWQHTARIDGLRKQLKDAEQEIRELTRPHLSWEEATS